MKFIAKIFLPMFMLCALLLNFSAAEATVVKGYAPIENGDITKAKGEARRYAMREVIEQVVGVHVSSTTEVANFEVVKDEIIAKSDGYITINRVIKEEARGDIFYVELDVTASAERIRATEQDLRAKIESNVNDSNSRGGIQVAVVQRDSSGNYSYDNEMGDYLNYKLKLQGFNAVSNDEVTMYLLRHSTDPDVRQQVRRIARNTRGEENALMRGVLAVESARKVGGVYEAVVKASFELIGLDSSNVDVVSKYFKGVGSSERDAIFNARETATRDAVEELAKQALETVQTEQRGGYVNLKTTIIFDNVTNYQAQYPLIKSALDSAHCRVIRTTRPSQTQIAFFVSTDSYTGPGELADAIEAALPNIQRGIDNAAELGATKIRFTF